ncbi:MAG TPA: nucleotidyltransferase domain-containing protein [Caulobacterales bacterium]|nr:nucleotidyltransferase domain-containing protein [Caulobacterales bacterium]
MNASAATLSEIRADPVLAAFRDELRAAYGERLHRLILFGSRARGEARPDSDYDLAVVLRDFRSFSQEAFRLGDLAQPLIVQFGKAIHAQPFRPDQIDARTPLMHEIRREGLDV